MIYKYYGPPGTGKTYRLISRARAYQRIGTRLDRIGYFAFTRKAAKEARERMPVSDKKLPYFQTFHSFAYKTLQLKEENVMQPVHYELLGKRLGIRVSYSDKYNEEESTYLTCNNPYFQLINRAINKDIDIEEEFDLAEHDRKEINWNTLNHIYQNLLVYKAYHKLYDFNDMIKMLIDYDKIPKFDVVFIDEAQDLSPLQWKLYDKIKETTKDIYLAGDDDQAIFAWAGADVRRFIIEEAKEKVLKKSKRVSQVVQSEALSPILKIRGIRFIKKYEPRNYEGVAEYISNLGQIDLTKGKWLILTRTKDKAIEIMEELKKKNLYYQSNKGKSYKVRLYRRIQNYNRWVNNNDKLEEKEWKDILELTDKKKITEKINWYDLFTKVPEKEKNYIQNLLNQKENLDKRARIWVSTIHGIKGGEEDNVILCMHQGEKIKNSIRRSIAKSDEEHRVWYVGITRARNNLYKLKTNNKDKEYQII
jgi:DNA helicase-2/ATP-dependent DNA helicase PcrA